MMNSDNNRNQSAHWRLKVNGVCLFLACAGYLWNQRSSEDSLFEFQTFSKLLGLVNERKSFIKSISNELPESLRTSVDDSYDPCDNFYLYSCGAWISKKNDQQHSRKESLRSDGVAFYVDFADEKSWDYAQDAVSFEMKKLIENPYPADSPFKPVQDWYTACMNEELIEENGVSPLNETLQLLDHLGTADDVNRALAHFMVWKIPIFMSFKVLPHFSCLQTLVFGIMIRLLMSDPGIVSRT